MKIIGHRGAAGLALENTLDGFELAKILGVDAIELDIHITKDQQLVVVHDNDLKRVGNSGIIIKNHNLKDIQKIILRDGHSRVPTLQQVIKTTGDIPLVIEIKAEHCIEKLLKAIHSSGSRDISVVSFKHNELRQLRKLAPELKIYGNEQTKPIEIIQLARSLKLNGIGLNYWLLNPLTYWLGKRYGLDMFVYTVNSRFIGKIIQTLYPAVGICTDYPEKYLKHSYTIPEKPHNKL